MLIVLLFFFKLLIKTITSLKLMYNLWKINKRKIIFLNLVNWYDILIFR